MKYLNLDLQLKYLRYLNESLLLLTDAVGDFDGLGLAEHGHAAVALLLVRAGPVLVRVLGHGGDVGRQRLLRTLCFLQAQDVGTLLTDPLWR